uniref:Uncharacterized protein n=1 Tax=Romanomermis culicivorax TaxID=13658 RepID=A0A915JYL2_ROMCU
MQRLTKFC